MSKPPQHSIDASPILILPSDPAWDHERIEAELTELDEADRRDHAWAKYIRGDGRYDLNARSGDTCAADYLLPDEKPTRFHLRRLGPLDLADVQSMFQRAFREGGESGDYLATWAKACQLGLLEVDGPGAVDLSFRRGKMTDESLQALFDELGGFAAVGKIGSAIFEISQPLGPTEKKR